jgi:hypothetical protein
VPAQAALGIVTSAAADKPNPPKVGVTPSSVATDMATIKGPRNFISKLQSRFETDLKQDRTPLRLMRRNELAEAVDLSDPGHLLRCESMESMIDILAHSFVFEHIANSSRFDR